MPLLLRCEVALAVSLDHGLEAHGRFEFLLLQWALRRYCLLIGWSSLYRLLRGLSCHTLVSSRLAGGNPRVPKYLQLLRFPFRKPFQFASTQTLHLHWAHHLPAAASS